LNGNFLFLLAAKARAEQNGQDLTDEWVKNSVIKSQKKKEDEDRNNKIIATMHAMLKTQEEEDRAKRELQKQNQRKYQEDLDQQVNALRQRSIDTLKSKCCLHFVFIGKKLFNLVVF
jgi:hypothetical protein